MPILVADHRLNDFDTWFEIFSANPPPAIGNWRIARGIDDPNRVHVVAEIQASDVGALKEFIDSEQMQAVFREVDAMSAAPIEWSWLDEITPG